MVEDEEKEWRGEEKCSCQSCQFLHSTNVFFSLCLFFCKFTRANGSQVQWQACKPWRKPLSGSGSGGRRRHDGSPPSSSQVFIAMFFMREIEEMRRRAEIFTGSSPDI